MQLLSFIFGYEKLDPQPHLKLVQSLELTCEGKEEGKEFWTNNW